MILLLCFLWSGEIIKNGPKPSRAVDVKLVHDLTIGGEDAQDEAIFSGTTTVATDDSGRIFVNDPGNFRVAIFNSDGALIKTFGREGGGPGEFSEPVAVAVDPKNQVYVFDTGHKKVARFNRDGDLLGEVSFNPSIQGVIYPSVLANGNRLLTAYLFRDQDWMMDLGLYDSDMKLIKSLGAAVHERLDFSRANQSSYWVDMLVGNFETALKGIPTATPLGDGFFFGNNGAYTGEIMTNTGKPMASMTREFKPRPFSEDARYIFCEQMWQDLRANPALTRRLPKPVFERAINKTEFPPALHPMSALASFRDGMAIVSSYNPARKNGVVDFYDKKGRFIATTHFEAPLKYFYGNNTHLFTVGFDEDDAVVVNRYKVEGL